MFTTVSMYIWQLFKHGLSIVIAFFSRMVWSVSSRLINLDTVWKVCFNTFYKCELNVVITQFNIAIVYFGIQCCVLEKSLQRFMVTS